MILHSHSFTMFLRTLILTLTTTFSLSSLCFGNESEPKFTPDEKVDVIHVFKELRIMLLMTSEDTVVRYYHIALGANPVGHKQMEADERTPEGTYKIDAQNNQSQFYRSLHISYPNRRDRDAAKKLGVSPGGDIMIHGFKNGYEYLMPPIHFFFNWTDGCIAVSNNEMAEILDLVKIGTPITIHP